MSTARRFSIVGPAWLAVVVCSQWAAPADGGASGFNEKDRGHWAYQPVVRPEVPPVKNDQWVRTPVDAFILARLEAAGLAPAEVAGRRTLIRRATFDLHGLPPTPGEIKAFVEDQRPGAYERLIERLLASPRYGERWARHWLDLSRYAESDGYKADVVRPGAWRYRDWVIRALNDDVPYDRFVSEQLAGDEIAPHRGDALVATGFLRHWPYEDNGRDLDRQWAAILGDVTETTGQVLLGLTVGCAKCHDHKYDAIKQKDYYRLQAFFAAMVPRDDLPVGPNERLAEYYQKLEKWRQATAELRAERRRLESPYHQQAQKAMGPMFPPLVQTILDRRAEQRTPYERQLVTLAGAMLRVDTKKMAGRMSGEVRKQWDALNERIAKFDELRPPEPEVTRGVRDVSCDVPATTIPGEPRDVIAPGFLSVLDAGEARIAPVESNPDTSGRRAALARWITDPHNPLTARVMVNRIWQYHFGRGIVATSGDFGTQGTPPTHPQLLDWLAAEFVERGWSMKQVHRLMMNSATYRQSARVSPGAAGAATDPANDLLWRMRTRRLEAEVLRDSLLAAGGELSLKMYGPSVLPELPPDLSARYGWKPTPGAVQQNRRSIYLIVKRNTQLPLLKTFDVPDSHHACNRRSKTTTPSQALILLNGAWPFDRARAMAGRLLAGGERDPAELVRRAYEVAYGRLPEEEEVESGRRFLNEQAETIRGRIKDKQKVAAAVPLPKNVDRPLAAALVDYCHALVGANEFLYVD